MSEMISGDIPPVPEYRGDIEEYSLQIKLYLEEHLRSFFEDLKSIHIVNTTITEEGAGLPDIESGDADKVLTVNDGETAAVWEAIPSDGLKGMTIVRIDGSAGAANYTLTTSDAFKWQVLLKGSTYQHVFILPSDAPEGYLFGFAQPDVGTALYIRTSDPSTNVIYSPNLPRLPASAAAQTCQTETGVIDGTTSVKCYVGPYSPADDSHILLVSNGDGNFSQISIAGTWDLFLDSQAAGDPA